MKRRTFTNLIMVLVIALLAFVTIACGGGSIELEKPKNVKYDGTTISWNKVENAEYYTVSINDGEEYEVSGTIYPFIANGQTFTVKITAVSALKKLVKSESTTMSFMALGNITDIRVNEDGSIEWDAVENATAYSLKIDGQEIEVLDTKYTELEPGSHTINVKPIVSGNNSFYSSYMKSNKSITICGVVAKEDIKYADGHITWKYVQGARYYEIRINGEVKSSELTGTSYQYDPLNNDFAVEIRAIGNHAETFDGRWSDTKNFVFLDTITNVTVVDGVLTWPEVGGADGYKIKLNGTVQADILTEPKFDRLAVNVSTDVEIMPVSSDSTYFSNWSAVKSVLVLASPVLKWNETLELDGQANNNLYWDQIANAAGYSVRVTLPNGTQEIKTFGETQVYFPYDYLEVGTYIVEVKTLASTTSTGVYDSLYSNPVKVIRLDTPKPADNYIVSDPNNLSDGFVVTFQGVAGATEYRLFKDNALHLKSLTPQFDVKNVSDSASIEEQTYNFYVQSVGSVRTIDGVTVATLSSLTSKALSFNITVLATPATPDISGYSYTYGSIDRNNGYVIDVGGQSYFSENTTYDLSGLEAGNYVVKVCAKGNGSNVLASNYSTPINVFRLEAPTNVKIETSDASEGLLTYTGVQYAKGYYIVFNNDGNALSANEIGNVNQYITEQGTLAYMQSSANYFNDDKTIYYMTSQPGITYNFIKLSKPTFGEVAFTNNQLVWKAPENINANVYTPSYEVYYPNGVTYNGEKNGTTMDISYLKGGESYTFEVKAIGNGTNYINSEKSTPVTIYKLATPEVKRENGKYVWGGVANAVSYVIYIDGVEVEKYTHVSGSTYSHTPLFKELKDYKVEVLAVGDGGYTSISSDKFEIVQKTKMLTTPDFSYKYSEEAYTATGNIIVTITDKPAYATGYSYKIGDVTNTSAEDTFSYCTNSVGKFEIVVYALGGSFDEEGTYYLDSSNQGGNGSRTITLLPTPNPSAWKLTADGILSWTAIADADKYEIEITCGGETTKYETTKVSFNVPDYSMSKGYTIKIRVIGNGTTTISSEQVERTWSPGA